MGETPWAIFVGAGAGASERLHTQLSYLYGINTPLKIALEYGLPGLGAYLEFGHFLGLRRRSG